MASKYRQRLLQSSGTSSRRFESEYAKKLMLKMGWKEGSGLGKNENGNTECIQVKRKDDNNGLGTTVKSAWNDPWWNDTYDRAMLKLKSKIKKNKQSSSQSSDSQSSQDSTPLPFAKKTKIICKKK